MIGRVRLFMQLVKFEHTIFALPYAYLGTVLAGFSTTGAVPSFRVFLWVTLAMVGARSAAMALNRVIDQKFDALNPRTANREIPKGIISSRDAVMFIVLSLLLLGVSAWMLNTLCLVLLPVAVIFLVGYSYTKRYTWLCHLILGITDALAPLGGWIAVTGRFDAAGIILAAAVGLWIAGFDIIYACQDVEIDRRLGLHSVPARFGVKRALMISKVLHIVTVLLFLSLPLFVHLGIWYVLGTAIVAVLLIVEHRLISPHDMTRINVAFFTVNSYIASVAFVFTCLDVVLQLYTR
ncbi:UbiA-like polyprenyltransferase [Paenibacillus thalictri]|uniref:4-hydroxybenzoate polyprenyltransferase n=1 Tax=Paenibacillus thalictri TaxID=2527873 RepID=A0A4Q9DUR9_9BACL|nr:UbiA-like polyprenyltransferase [Paenibacillus thalictri]TBL79995.1 4-hydroxybenzoate octaprenyltransferase [Paenibacillus thalictri]